MRCKRIVLPESFKEKERLIQEAHWFNLPELVSELNRKPASEEQRLNVENKTQNLQQLLEDTQKQQASEAEGKKNITLDLWRKSKPNKKPRQSKPSKSVFKTQGTKKFVLQNVTFGVLQAIFLDWIFDLVAAYWEFEQFFKNLLKTKIFLNS